MILYYFNNLTAFYIYKMLLRPKKQQEQYK